MKHQSQETMARLLCRTAIDERNAAVALGDTDAAIHWDGVAAGFARAADCFQALADLASRRLDDTLADLASSTSGGGVL